MIIVYGILILFAVFGFRFVYWSSKLKEGCPVVLIFGKRGCGKSSDIVRRALEHKKKTKGQGRVFCTDETMCQDGLCEYIPPEQLGRIRLPKGSLLLIEECGVLFHKRGFSDKQQNAIMKNFRRYLKYVRHEEIASVVMYSQCYDIDLSLKEACSELWLYKKLGCYTYGKKICKSIVLTTDADGNGTMSDSFTFYPFITKGARRLNFIPRYIRHFDSYSKLPDLIDYDSAFPKLVSVSSPSPVEDLNEPIGEFI